MARSKTSTAGTERADEIEQRVRECTEIMPEAIQEEFVRLPADLAYWNAQYAEALREHLMAKAAEKRVRAQVYLRVRTDAADSGVKMTEAMVDATVEADDFVQEAVRDSINAESSKARMYGVVDAVRAKKESLISLGAQLRSEMDGDPSIRRANRDSHEANRD